MREPKEGKGLAEAEGPYAAGGWAYRPTGGAYRGGSMYTGGPLCIDRGPRGAPLPLAGGLIGPHVAYVYIEALAYGTEAERLRKRGVSIRQHMSAYVSIRQLILTFADIEALA